MREREFQTVGGPQTLKALVDNANDVRGTVSNMQFTSRSQTVSTVIVMDQVRQVGWSRDCAGLVDDDCQFV